MGLSLAGFCEAYGRYNISAVVFDKKSKTDAWWWVPVCMGINN
jgi:hypothetical protein